MGVTLKEQQWEWLQKLRELSLKHPQGVRQDIFITKNQSKDLPVPKAWVNLEHYDIDYALSPVDFRTLLWNEVVFDLDHHDYKNVYAAAYRIIYTLKKLHAPHYIFPTSGKGLHISVFLDAKGKQNEVDWSAIRLGVFNYIRAMSFVPDQILNGQSGNWGNIREAVFNYLNGNDVNTKFDAVIESMTFMSDISKIRWSDTTLGSLVRCEGGGRYRKIGEDKYIKLYKGWVFTLPPSRVEITEPWEVAFPPYIKEWEVPDRILMQIKECPKPKSDPKYIPKRDVIPPCLAHQIERVVKNGENLSHHARFAIAAYLNRMGWAKESIKDIFRNSPDYSERTTTYMVDDIVDNNYTPPNCKTLRSYGLCAERCERDRSFSS